MGKVRVGQGRPCRALCLPFPLSETQEPPGISEQRRDTIRQIFSGSFWLLCYGCEATAGRAAGAPAIVRARGQGRLGPQWVGGAVMGGVVSVQLYSADKGAVPSGTGLPP